MRIFQFFYDKIQIIPVKKKEMNENNIKIINKDTYHPLYANRPE